MELKSKGLKVPHLLLYYWFRRMLFSMIWNISCGAGIRPDSSLDHTGTSVNKKQEHLSTRNRNICQQETGTSVNNKRGHLSTNGDICQQQTGTSVNNKWGHLSTTNGASLNNKHVHLSTTNMYICQHKQEHVKKIVKPPFWDK